jgi:putative transcriptional regulator
LYWGGDFEEICDLIENGQVSADEIKFFVGYSGWSELQLEGEFEQDSWVICDYKSEYVFKDQDKTLWNICLEAKQTKISIYSKFAHTPSLN